MNSRLREMIEEPLPYLITLGVLWSVSSFFWQPRQWAERTREASAVYCSSKCGVLRNEYALFGLPQQPDSIIERWPGFASPRGGMPEHTFTLHSGNPRYNYLLEEIAAGRVSELKR